MRLFLPGRCTLHEQLGDVGGGAGALSLLAELAGSASLHLALMRTWTQSLADVQEAEDALLECSLEVDSKVPSLPPRICLASVPEVSPSGVLTVSPKVPDDIVKLRQQWWMRR